MCVCVCGGGGFGSTELRKVENYVPSLFFKKAGDNKNLSKPVASLLNPIETLFDWRFNT